MHYDLKKDSKIYVAGHKGLIGSAFIRFFKKNGYTNIVIENRDNLDLCSQSDTYNFFEEHQPEVVILAAGYVAGIKQNRDFPADFINENISIQLNVFKAAKKNNVKKLIFFGSSCMYPLNALQPLSEGQLGSGHPESTSIAYASAKYAGIQMCHAINRQYDLTSFISVIPNTVYGINDNFDLNSSHVLPALIRRFYEAKKVGKASVTLWGTGSPKREFVYSDDVVSACILLLKTPLTNVELPINIGTGYDLPIRDLAEKIACIVGYAGSIEWDSSKTDGSPRKLLDNSKIELLGWKPEFDLDKGINEVFQWYKEDKI